MVERSPISNFYRAPYKIRGYGENGRRTFLENGKKMISTFYLSPEGVLTNLEVRFLLSPPSCMVAVDVIGSTLDCDSGGGGSSPPGHTKLEIILDFD